MGEGTPARKAYGRYKNVILLDVEYKALVMDFGEGKAADYIERLGRHMQSTGKTYASHEATIRSWILEDQRKAETKTEAPAKGSAKPNRFHNFDQGRTDYEAVLKQADGG